MAIYGHKWTTFGAMNLGYSTGSVDFAMNRTELEDNVIEYKVERRAGGRWNATVGASLFNRGAANKILSGYVNAATVDIPYVGAQGFTAGDDAEIVLCNLFKPVGSGGFNAEGRSISDLRAVISSRAPLHTAYVLHYEQSTAGLTADTFGAGYALGAIPAGSEGIFVATLRDWPTMAGTAVGTFTLEHSAVGSSVNLDAGPAVDKGAGLVGLPSTGHGFVAGQVVRVIGTTNYDGENLTLDATTSVNELVITATYVAETFAGTETVDDLWDSPTTAVETTGTNPWTPSAGTPSYMVITIDGDTTAITDTFWRFKFTTITETIYPACAAAIVVKEWD